MTSQGDIEFDRYCEEKEFERRFYFGLCLLGLLVFGVPVLIAVLHGLFIVPVEEADRPDPPFIPMPHRGH